MELYFEKIRHKFNLNDFEYIYDKNRLTILSFQLSYFLKNFIPQLQFNLELINEYPTNISLFDDKIIITIYKYLVCSFNLGYSIIENTIYGSEAPMVTYCQQSYPKNNGWSDITPKISQCTYNALTFLQSYDIFGLQEINPLYTNTIIHLLSDYNFVSQNELLICYKKQIFGDPIIMTDIDGIGPPGNRRGMQAVWFHKLKLLFVNLHAPHNIDLHIELTKELIKLENNIDKYGLIPRRIIMTGDFNDYNGSLLHIQIQFKHLFLTIPGHATSCCTDSGYIYAGDYIFDSSDKTTFGLPLNYQRMHPPMSDHDPVVLI